MENRKIRVAITHGDTNGIGYELIFKTFSEPQMLELCTPIVYGSPKVAAYHRKALNIQANFSIINDASEACDGRLNLLTCFDDEIKVDLGMGTPESGIAALKALDRAMTDFRNGCFDVLVSCPTNCGNMLDENFKFTGLNNYLETSIGEGHKSVNMLINDTMRIVSATDALNLKNVAVEITKCNIEEKVGILFESLKRDFRLSNPRVAVLALNPEAMGDEESNEIIPAVEELSSTKPTVFGPYSAKSFFGTGMYDAFDGVLAMYDDQAQIPFGTLTSGNGIYYIAGLPLVCTSPAIHSCYDNAGQGTVDESGFRSAVYAAIDIFRNRFNYDAPLANPLRKLYHEKRDESEKVRFSVAKRHDGTAKENPQQA